MMHLTSDIDRGTFFFVVVCIVLFFLILGFALIFFVLFYNKKRSQHISEKQLLQVQFQKSLLQGQLDMQEQTFNIISQEIHDNVGQVLSLAKVQLNIIDQTNGLSNDRLTEVKENIGKAITDLRDIAKSLSTDRIQAAELKELIEGELNRIGRTGIFKTHLYIQGNPREITAQRKLILFRILQESFQNIIKHSQATAIISVLKYEEEHLEILIYDNGKGFNPLAVNGNAKGLGLQNMQSRTKLINGLTEIESTPGSGTAIKFTIPYA